MSILYNYNRFLLSVSTSALQPDILFSHRVEYNSVESEMGLIHLLSPCNSFSINDIACHARVTLSLTEVAFYKHRCLAAIYMWTNAIQWMGYVASARQSKQNNNRKAANTKTQDYG